MKQHRYRVTVERLADESGGAGEEGAFVDDAPLRFEAGSHDDVFMVVERVRGCGEFDEATATAFAVGLKLFGGAMLEHRENPLFEAFYPAFVEFMKRLKGRIRQG
jgi:hypothetical protein